VRFAINRCEKLSEVLAHRGFARIGSGLKSKFRAHLKKHILPSAEFRSLASLFLGSFVAAGGVETRGAAGICPFLSPLRLRGGGTLGQTGRASDL
jgi:hypothetical protein